MTWAMALAETRCYDFLEPVAARAVDRALELCLDAATLVGDDARKDMLALCLSRLGVVYERPLMSRAVGRVGFADNLALNGGDDGRAKVMRRIAGEVRDEVMADAGASLRDRLPLALDYENAVADNFSQAMAEFLGRLLSRRGEVSKELLGGTSHHAHRGAVHERCRPPLPRSHGHARRHGRGDLLLQAP